MFPHQHNQVHANDRSYIRGVAYQRTLILKYLGTH
jgi:hypothetical protein